MSRPLTPKQRLFVHEYLVDLNGTQAAIRAGYSPKTAAEQASDLLRLPNIAAEVQEATEARARKTGITSEKVLGELDKLAHVDLAEAFDDKGQLLPIRKMPEHVRRAISAYEVGADGVVKVKFHSKDRALELLGKHLRLYTDRVEHSAVHGLADLLARARARARSRT